MFWVEAAVSLDDAKARIQVLQIDLPGEYFIFNQKTGARHAEQPDAGAESTRRPSSPSEARL